MTYPEETSFWVDGIPATQGSKRHVGKGRMIETSKGLPAWRKAVHERAAEQAHMIGQFHDGPLHLEIVFYLPHGKQKEHSPWKRQDLDKLTRAVGDSLKTGGLITDDSRFTTINATKIWALERPGAQIIIRELG